MALIILFLTLPALALATSAEGAPRPSGTERQAPGRPEEGVFSRNWRGMLVDIRCGASSADRSAEPDAPPPFGPDVPHLTLKDWEACPATAGSTEFGLVFFSGRAVRLDAQSNARVAGELGRRSKWTEGQSPPLAKIKGTLYGDTLHVESMKQIEKLR